MKISKIFLSVFLVGFLLFGFLYVWNGIQYGKKKAVWEAEVERLDVHIATLEAEVEASMDSADTWRDRAFEKVEEATELEVELQEAKRQHAVSLARIAELTPTELVLRTRIMLGASEDEVVLTPEGVVFSLDITRTLLTQLENYDFVISQQVPGMEQAAAKWKGAFKDKDKKAIDLRKANTFLLLELEEWKKKYKGEYDLRIDAERKGSLFSTQNLVMGAVVAAVVWGIILFMK